MLGELTTSLSHGVLVSNPGRASHGTASPPPSVQREPGSPHYSWATVPAVQTFVVQPFFWQTWWFRIGVGGLAIAAASLAGIGVARVRLQRRIENAERQQAVEHERARIARDIHDDLGASLTRLTLLSQTAMTENAAGRSTAPELDAIYNTTSELTRSMDEIVWAVNPRHDSLDSLANFLGKFAQEYLQTAQIRCRLDLPAGLPATPVPAEVRHNVFLATKEVLNNSVKHAGTTEVRLALAATQDGFRLTLEDNGRGALHPLEQAVICRRWCLHSRTQAFLHCLLSSVQTTRHPPASAL